MILSLTTVEYYSSQLTSDILFSYIFLHLGIRLRNDSSVFQGRTLVLHLICEQSSKWTCTLSYVWTNLFVNTGTPCMWAELHMNTCLSSNLHVSIVVIANNCNSFYTKGELLINNGSPCYVPFINICTSFYNISKKNQEYCSQFCLSTFMNMFTVLPL